MKRGRTALAVAIVVASAIALTTAYGADPASAIIYFAYECGYVVVPGWFAYRALSRRSTSPIRQLAMGWALGYVIEILVFMLTAATDARGMFAAYPVVVVAIAALVLARRRAEPLCPVPHLPRLFVPLCALACIAAMAYVALSFFPLTPLPGTSSVTYVPDFSWAISLAAEAKTHWPIGDPNVAGEPMPYHYFVNIHLAAASQVTGLELPLVFFRLFILPLVVALVLQIVVVGQMLTRSAYTGLIAVMLVLFIGELQLDPRHTGVSQLPFAGIFFTLLTYSPSFLFGLVLFLPLIALLGERLGDRTERVPGREWVLLALFMIGASDAKVAILPLTLAALLLYAAWTWWVNRRVPPAVWWASGMAILVMGGLYLLQYRGQSGGLVLDPAAGVEFLGNMPAVSIVAAGLKGVLPDVPGDLIVSVGAIGFGFVGLLAAQLIGLVWIVRRRGVHLLPEQRWLAALLGASLVAMLVLSAPGTINALYFFFYGVVGGCLLAADGLRTGWSARPVLGGQERLEIVWLSIGWVMFLVALIFAPLVLDRVVGGTGPALTYVVWYLGLLLGFVTLYQVAKRRIEPGRWAGGALVCGAVLTVGFLNVPVDTVVPALAGRPAPPVQAAGLTPGLLDALEWLRDNTPPETVVAVNASGLFEFDYAAFGERRVFLGGWAYSPQSREGEYAQLTKGLVNPFTDRLMINTAAFAYADERAIRSMTEEYGVGMFLVDRVNGPPSDVEGLMQSGRTVYESPDAVIVKPAVGAGRKPASTEAPP